MWGSGEMDGTRGVGKRGRSGQVHCGAGGEDRAAAVAPDNNLAQRARPACRCWRALQRKDRVGESRSTSTMTVDDDGDGGGEACAAMGNVHRRRRRKISL
ncbi:hypothetical protein Syun_016925 [Stephania yunnanensis]|uniref:Uncharacterized protein n=1 Tax=Stephania yunnanensis TaxID=152371 RepID=A0AAP0J629_9MAGN